MREITVMEKQAKGLAQVMGRGKITIPKEARVVLGINDGDYVGFIVWKVEVVAPEGE